MTTIQDALLRIYRLEGDPTDADDLPLAITSPIGVAIKKVWPYSPPAKNVITSTPCFVNTWSVTSAEYGSAIRTTHYSVHARLICYDANSDRAAAIAAAFMEPLLDRFGANIKLSGLPEWMLNTLRFDGEQPVLFQDLSEAAGRELIGLNFFIDITHRSAATNAAGAAPSWA